MCKRFFCGCIVRLSYGQILILCLTGMFTVSWPAQGDTLSVRTIEERVALFATSNSSSEVVAWLPRGEELRTVDKTVEALWLRVVAPESVNLWLYKDLLRDGRVLADKTQVRSGPGMNYLPVAQLGRGAIVEIRGVFGDWIKIKPPAGSLLWLLRDKVEPILAEAPPKPDFLGELLQELTNTNENLKAFPPAQTGQTRHVLMLPECADESLFKVELIVGKSVETDEANRYFFLGKLEEETIEGWGFNYFSLQELGPMAGTLIAVQPDVPKVRRFVSLGGEPHLLRYNSRLPLVVYVPEGVEVYYRLWRADRKPQPVAIR